MQTWKITYVKPMISANGDTRKSNAARGVVPLFSSKTERQPHGVTQFMLTGERLQDGPRLNSQLS